MKVELIAITQPVDGSTSEELLEHAGRICYRSSKRGEPGKFLQNRIREGHLSITEHSAMTFEISGISRVCSHQLVRHRIGSFSQESQRCIDMSEPYFVWPPDIQKNLEAKMIYRLALETACNAYEALRSLGVRKEDARFLLPNATATRISASESSQGLWRSILREGARL